MGRNKQPVVEFHYDRILRRRPGYRRNTDEFAAASRLPDFTLECLLKGEDVTEANAWTVALMGVYQAQGRPTFLIDQRVAAMFAHTSVDVTENELVMPCSAFYIALPDSPYRIWGGNRTQWHHVEGMYIYREGDRLRVHMLGMDNKRSEWEGDDAVAWMIFDLHGPKNLETQLRDGMELLQDSPSSKFDGSPQGVPSITALCRIAVNLCLYLASENPDVATVAYRRPETPLLQDLRRQLKRAKTSRKRKKIERKLAELSTTSAVLVGASIEARAAAQVKEHGSVSAHWVRGHWHHYWTGPGRTVKTLRWIEPYPKGLAPLKVKS